MSVLDRAYRFYRANGVGALPVKTLRYVRRKLPSRPAPIARLRRRLGKQLFDRAGGTVLAGPLAGFRLAPTSNWGGAAYGPMVLGIYETNVMEALIAAGRERDLLIDIGAADGYFGVGLVAKGHFRRAACFDIDPISRGVLRDVAEANGVGDRIAIFERAGDDLASQLAAAGMAVADAVVLCDIEGGEFDLLTSRFLAPLKDCTVIVELHDGFFDDGAVRVERLVADAGRFFSVDYLDIGSRALPDHAAVSDLTEDDRWLLCSEGRGIEQRWLVLSPKAD